MQSQDHRHVKILDCTLRDGGYYTNWNFSGDLVADYVKTVNSLPIDMVELGLVGKSSASGYFASIDDRKAVDVASDLKAACCVMMDAKDVTSGGATGSADVTRLIAGLTPRRVSTVRVAVRFDMVSTCRRICRALIDEGFAVFLNLMQVDAADAAEARRCFAEAGRIEGLKVLYLADSFGSMTPDRVHALFGQCREHVGVELGFHGHANRGYAMLNSLSAVSAGATWVDATMGGMGRGAGNTASEQLIPLLRSLQATEERGLLEFVSTFLDPLSRKFGWGSSSAYLFAGVNCIHPSYVQALREDGSLSEAEIIARISSLRPSERTSFSADRLARPA